MEWKLVVSKVVMPWSVLSLIPPDYLLLAVETSLVAISERWQWGLILPGRSRKCPLCGIANRLKLKRRFSIGLDYPDEGVKLPPPHKFLHSSWKSTATIALL